MADKPLKSIKFPGLEDTYTIPQVDDTLEVAGAAADAAATGATVGELKSAFDDALAPSVGLYNLCTGIQKGKYWVAWSGGDTVTPAFFS